MSTDNINSPKWVKPSPIENQGSRRTLVSPLAIKGSKVPEFKKKKKIATTTVEGSKHWLLYQRTWVQFVGPTLALTTILNASSRKSDTPLASEPHRQHKVTTTGKLTVALWTD